MPCKFVAGAMCRLLIGLSSLLISLAGCGSEPEGPPIFPVRGKIEFVRGGTVQELNNVQAIIEFESVDQPGVRAYGEILEDGSFTLGSTKDGQPLHEPGVVAGVHRGRFNLDEEYQDLVAPEFMDAEKSGITFTAPTEQEVIVKVWR